MTKRCPRCKEHKPVDQFSKNRRSADGLAFYCKKCQQKYTTTWVKTSRTGWWLKYEKSLEREKRKLAKYFEKHPPVYPEDYNTKKCTKCKETRSIFDFHLAHSTNSGLSSWCKYCTTTKDKGYKRRSGRNQHYYDKTKHRTTYRQRYRANHPDAAKAQRVISYLRSNEVLVPQPCERCGSAENIEAHHEDYSKILEVTWLCRACHLERHRELREAQS
jgi:Mg2+ and Co2+ transporter CorA